MINSKMAKSNGDNVVHRKSGKQQEMIMQLFVSSRKKGPQEVDLMMEKAMDKDTASLEAALFEFFTTFSVGIYGKCHSG